MNVTKDTVTREVMVPQTVTEDGVTIQLNMEETAALIAVLGSIAGYPKQGPNLREVATKPLWNELQVASGLSWADELVAKYYVTIREQMRLND